MGSPIHRGEAVSYCRNNGTDSDVYVILTRNPETGRNVLRCFCGTVDLQGLYEAPFPEFTTRTGMIRHLLEHRRNGDKVPARAFERLGLEIGEEGDDV
jgi:hypothetical protein